MYEFQLPGVAPELHEPDENSYIVKREDLELKIGRPLTPEEDKLFFETGQEPEGDK